MINPPGRVLSTNPNANLILRSGSAVLNLFRQYEAEILGLEGEGLLHRRPWIFLRFNIATCYFPSKEVPLPRSGGEGEDTARILGDTLLRFLARSDEGKLISKISFNISRA